MSGNAVERLALALGEAIGTEVELERPNDPAHGDYATSAAMRLAPVRRRAPRELGEEIAATALALPDVERAEVAGPGFVNLWLADEWYAQALDEILRAGDRYGAGDPEARLRVQVELVSANPTGPLTVAHARNAAYGDSVARLLAFAGHEVEREYYYNDAGRQIELFRASVEARRRGEEPPADGYRVAYVDEVARLDGDPVALMVERIEARMDRVRVDFDSFVREVELIPEIPAALERIETSEAEGTVWARTTAFGDDKDRPLVRSTDGSYLYFAKDVAYLAHKFERGFDRAIYVLGADHHGYVRRLKAAAAMLGYDPEAVEVLIYQLVHLIRGGELAKVSKRRGDVVFLDELVDEIGVDAARPALARGARPRQAAGRLPGDGRGRHGAPRAARDRVLRDPARRRLPPLLPRPPRDRRRDAGRQRLSARPRRGGADGDGAGTRPARGRSARAHVAPPSGADG